MIRRFTTTSLIAIFGIIITGVIVGVLTHGANAEQPELSNLNALSVTDNPHDREEILWFARAVYSETKRPEEMRLVAWVVRNRVEASYKGTTYKEVVLARKQFSGLNPTDVNYQHNISRTYESVGKDWKNALDIARAVYYADEVYRPISASTLHFYSPRSMKNGATPKWAVGKIAVHTVSDPEEKSVRFAFYDGVR